VPRQQSANETDPANILIAVLFSETESSAELTAKRVSIQHFDLMPALRQLIR
jgi:hypothetical protein